MARADPEPPRSIQQANRTEDTIRVVEGLSHAHEDDVVVPRGGAGTPVRAERQPRLAVPVQHLVDDLTRAQLASEASLTGGAEGATHGASGLRADADRRPVPSTPAPVTHQDRLDPLAVRQLVHRLGSQAAIGLQGVAGADGREAERSIERPAERGGQIGQVIEARDAGAMSPSQDLAGPIRGLAAGDEPRGELMRIDFADRRGQAGE